MSFESRLFKTGSVERVTEADDGFGGTTKVETEVVAALGFHAFNITPWDREVVTTLYGVEPSSVVLKASAGWNATVQNTDVIQVSATEKYRILSISPMYGRSSTPKHMSMLLQEEVND